MADGYITLPGTAGNYVSAPDTAGLSLAGDFELRADVALNNYSTGSADSGIVAKFENAKRSYMGVVHANLDKLGVYFSENGSATSSRISTNTMGQGNTTRLHLRWTVDISVATCSYYYRTDTSLALSNDTGWTDLGGGAAVARASLHDNDAAVELGSWYAGTSGLWAGLYYQALIYNGIGGSIVANPDFRSATQTSDGGATFVDDSGNTWTVNGTAAWTAPTGGTGTDNTILLGVP